MNTNIDYDYMIDCVKRAQQWDEKKRGGLNKHHQQEILVTAKRSYLNSKTFVTEPMEWQSRNGERWYTREVYVPSGKEPRAVMYKMSYHVVEHESKKFSIYIAAFSNKQGFLPILEITPEWLAEKNTDIRSIHDIHFFFCSFPIWRARPFVPDTCLIDIDHKSALKAVRKSDHLGIWSVTTETTQVKRTKEKYHLEVCQNVASHISDRNIRGKMVVNFLTLKDIVVRSFEERGYKNVEAEAMSTILANVVNICDIMELPRINLLNRDSGEDYRKLEDDILGAYVKKSKKSSVTTSEHALPVIVDFIKAFQKDTTIRVKDIVCAFLITLAVSAEKNADLDKARKTYKVAQSKQNEYPDVWRQVRAVMEQAGLADV